MSAFRSELKSPPFDPDICTFSKNLRTVHSKLETERRIDLKAKQERALQEQIHERENTLPSAECVRASFSLDTELEGISFALNTLYGVDVENEPQHLVHSKGLLRDALSYVETAEYYLRGVADPSSEMMKDLITIRELLHKYT